MPSLLLMTATFAPSRVIGGRRAERIAVHLSRAGWQVTVLTLHPQYMAPFDPDFRVEGDFEVLTTHALMPRVHARTLLQSLRKGGSATPPGTGSSQVPAAQGPVGQFRKVLATKARKLRPGIEKSLSLLEFPDMWMGWGPFARRAVRGRKFDVVLGTMPPFSTAPIARRIARDVGAKLVLDYRDPWCEILSLSTPNPKVAGLDQHRRHRELEDACLAAADLVIGVTPTICEWLRQRCRCEVALVTNAFASPERPPAPPDAARRPQRLVYAGSLAYGRDLTPILLAMAQLRPAFGPGDLRLEHAGPHGQVLREQAVALGVDDAVDDLGEVSSARALQMLDGALAGVVLVPPVVEYGYPGKIFEILGRGRPLLLVARQGSDSARLVDRHQLGWTHDAADVDGLAATLRRALAGEAPVPQDLDQLQADTVMADMQRRLAALVG